MIPIPTGDGSYTFYNEEFSDYYHSQSGAFEEAREKYVMPCQELFTKKHIVIFDIFFGYGYNSATAIKHIWDKSPATTIEIIALDKKSNAISVNHLVPPEYAKAHSLVCAGLQSQQSDTRLSFVFIEGDVKSTLLQVKQQADIVFWDAFKPVNCPELWSVHLFEIVRKRMNKGSMLTTYSYARFVRRNLQEAGFTVRDGPVVGRRSPSTIAYG